ncbi:MAG: hypothetical protein AB2A00_33685 [Myxococcota bacterium]
MVACRVLTLGSMLLLTACPWLEEKASPPMDPCPPPGARPSDDGRARIWQRGPGCTDLWLDEKVSYPVARPQDLPLVSSGEAGFEALAQEGEQHWYFTAQLEGEPFGVPAELMDAWIGNRPVEDVDALFETLEDVWHTGLVHIPGEELPRGLVRINEPEALATQNCSACHSGVVKGKLFAGVGNKWYDQKQLIRFARAMMEDGLPEPGVDDELRARIERQMAKLDRYDALYGNGCADLGPGMITAARIWEISSKLLTDPAQLADPAQAPRFLCGATKPPPLNTVRFRNQLFWDGSVSTLWVTHWPMFDFFGFDDYQRWSNKVVTREIQAMDAFIIFKSPSPTWEEVMDTAVDATAAARGMEIFHRQDLCASCHGSYAADGMLTSFSPSTTPLELIRTDVERAVAATDEVLQQFTQYQWVQVPRLEHAEGFAPGYAAMPLCSTFLNFPYLHTAGVANLMELLTEETARSPSYWQSDVTDDENVGFFTSVDPPDTRGVAPEPRVVQRTFRPELVHGHSGERFGTGLSLEEKRDLLEYLKSLRCPSW